MADFPALADARASAVLRSQHAWLRSCLFFTARQLRSPEALPERCRRLLRRQQADRFALLHDTLPALLWPAICWCATLPPAHAGQCLAALDSAACRQRRLIVDAARSLDALAQA